jgi:hypothetical protein
MSFAGTPRPQPRWWHATTKLHDFALITYRVQTDHLRRCLPAEFEPTVFAFDDGSQGSLVSAAVFSFQDFAFRALPWVSLSCGQVDYRTYGNLGGDRGVWFFGTSVDSPLVALPRLVWQMPWHRGHIRIESSWEGAEAGRLRLLALGDGAALCDLGLTGEKADRVDGLADIDETIEVLTHPTVGWFARGRRARLSIGRIHADQPSRIGRYSVWHEPMAPERADVRYARFSVFENLGLVPPVAEPHSALVQHRVCFDVHTPPQQCPVAPIRSP